MFTKRFLYFLVIILVWLPTWSAVANGLFQPNCEEAPEECPGYEPDYCEEFPEYCEEEGGRSGRGSAPPWSGLTDGRISPDPAEYYTIYCHPSMDTIYVVRVVPETETIKEIPLVDAVNLDIGQEQVLGDFMVMERTSENIITIYGSNGNLAPEPGSKSFNLADCISANGRAPDLEPPSDDNSGVGETPPDTEEDTQPRRREAEEALEFCASSYDFFGHDSSLLVDCLDYVLSTYQDALTGIEVLNLVIMVFCLNIAVGNGVLPIGTLLFLSWFRRRLRRQKSVR